LESTVRPSVFRAATRRSFARLAVAATALVLAAGCGGGGGAQGPWRDTLHRRSAVPGLGWELVPQVQVQVDGVPVRTSTIGARDGEPVAGRDVFRVAVLGGCFAFGPGLEESAVWPMVLERELQTSILVGGRTVDFLDLAVCGYDAPRQATVFEQRALPLDPWLIVLEHSFEDPAQPRVAALRALAGESASPSIAALHDPDGAPWKATVAAWQHVQELCGPRNLPVVLVIVPRLDGSPWDGYPYRALHAQVSREAGHHGFAVLDLLDAFSAEAPETLVTPAAAASASTGALPNEKAEAIAADRFKRFIFSSGVLQRVLEAH